MTTRRTVLTALACAAVVSVPQVPLAAPALLPRKTSDSDVLHFRFNDGLWSYMTLEEAIVYANATNRDFWVSLLK